MLTDLISRQLSTIQLPYLNVDPISAKWLKQLDVTDDLIRLHLHLGFPAETIKTSLQQAITEVITDVAGDKQIQVLISWEVKSHAVQAGLKGIANVKNIIAVASGKGGVGKSTTTANLALALTQMGAKVGILDADIYGPNQPQMLGISKEPEVTEEKKFIPLRAYGLQAMSIGLLLAGTDQPMIWRGPMVSSALQQLAHDTAWEDLDYLFIDLPPGTGDIQLTMSQKIPVSAAVIVTTPQDIALLDARKAVRMFEKVKVPVLGVVENMSHHRCSQCGFEQAIFGEGGAKTMANEYQIEHLGSLPLDITIRKDADLGKPTVVADPASQIAKDYRDIAVRIAAHLSMQKRELGSKFPRIVIENN